MKRVSVWFLALAMLVSLATPVLAANETVATTPQRQRLWMQLGSKPGSKAMTWV